MKRVFGLIMDFCEFYFSAACFGMLFLSLFLQVVLRYLFRYPSDVLYEISGFSFVWVVYLGGLCAWRYNDHMRFSAVYEKLPRKLQLALEIIFNLFFTVLLIICLGPILQDFSRLRLIKSTVLNISWLYLYVFFPLFIVFVIIHNGRFIYRDSRELFTGKILTREEKPWD
jgi:TRAP-type C4-dicarboxylate transport system permease small subunit